MYFFNYFIKCVIRRIVNSDWFLKISFLVLIVFVIGFLCNNIVYGAETITYIPSELGKSYCYPTYVGNSDSNLSAWKYYAYNNNADSFGNNSAFYFFGESGVEYEITFRITSTVLRRASISTSSEVPSAGVLCSPERVFSMEGAFSYTITVVGTGAYFNVTYNRDSYSADAITVSYTENNSTTIVGAIDTQTSQTTNAINNSSQIISNTVTEQGDRIEDTMTSTEYDDSVVSIDVSSAEDVDDTEVTGLFTTVFENLRNLISSSSWSTVEVIEIGLPYTDGKIQLRSDILSNIIGNSFLRTLINVSWYSLFGLYVFRFVTNIYHSIKSGNILNGIDFNNEVISSTML